MDSLKRNKAIDSLRGIAIVIMILANSWPYIYPFDSCPILLRIIFSTAAPIFVFISGYVNAIQDSSSGNLIKYRRPLQVLFIAVLIDSFVWKIVPFVTFDVLYLIAISMFMIRLLNKVKKHQLAIITLALLFSNVFFITKYDFNFAEINFTDNLSDYNLETVLNHFLFDGWFPVFPWMGIFFLGYYLSKYVRLKTPGYYLLVGLLMIFIYFVYTNSSLYFIQPMRKGYTELFYPLKGIFWFYLLGIICFIKFLIETNKHSSEVLTILGVFSLPIYLLHAIIISYALPFFSQSSENFSLIQLFLIMLLFYCFVYSFVFILNKYHQKLKGVLGKIAFIIGV